MNTEAFPPVDALGRVPTSSRGRRGRALRRALGATAVLVVSAAAVSSSDHAQAAEAVEPAEAAASPDPGASPIDPGDFVTGFSVVEALPPGAPVGPPIDPPSEADLDEFAACMAEHGVDVEVQTFDDEEVDGFGVAISGSVATPSAPSDAEIRELDKAHEECGAIIGLPDPGEAAAFEPMPELTAEQMAELEAAQREIDACLEEHGVSVPSFEAVPTSGSVTVVSPTDAEIDAFIECAPEGVEVAPGVLVGFAEAEVPAPAK